MIAGIKVRELFSSALAGLFVHSDRQVKQLLAHQLLLLFFIFFAIQFFFFFCELMNDVAVDKS